MNNRYLIDSHILIWLLYEPTRLGKNTIRLLEQAEAVSISTVSLWELSLKHRKGKLVYSPKELIEGAQVLLLKQLQLSNQHILKQSKINLPQADPFDSLLIAQSEAEGLIFLTADVKILQSRYQTHNASK